jgi:hypothetical protein
MTETAALPATQRSAPLLIFAHIPKTAGTTVAFILRRQYGRRRFLNLYQERSAKIQAYRDWTPQQRENVHLLRGHVGYGIHAALEETNFRYFTILRDPIDRVVSHYFFHKNRADSGNELSEKIVEEDIALLAYVTQVQIKDLDNHQTRLLVGDKVGMEPEFGACPRKFLNIAKRRLQEDFDVVGTTERFDETLLVLQRVFGWNIPVYISTNVTRNRPRGKKIDPGVKKAIAKNNKLDAALHEYANERLDELIAENFRFFKVNLYIFRKINKFYNYFYELSRSFPKSWMAYLDSTLFADNKEVIGV